MRSRPTRESAQISRGRTLQGWWRRLEPLCRRTEQGPLRNLMVDRRESGCRPPLLTAAPTCPPWIAYTPRSDRSKRAVVQTQGRLWKEHQLASRWGRCHRFRNDMRALDGCEAARSTRVHVQKGERLGETAHLA